jgi:hypothetical protein
MPAHSKKAPRQEYGKQIGSAIELAAWKPNKKELKERQFFVG